MSQCSLQITTTTTNTTTTQSMQLRATHAIHDVTNASNKAQQYIWSKKPIANLYRLLCFTSSAQCAVHMCTWHCVINVLHTCSTNKGNNSCRSTPTSLDVPMEFFPQTVLLHMALDCIVQSKMMGSKSRPRLREGQAHPRQPLSLQSGVALGAAGPGPNSHLG